MAYFPKWPTCSFANPTLLICFRFLKTSPTKGGSLGGPPFARHIFQLWFLWNLKSSSGSLATLHICTCTCIARFPINLKFSTYTFFPIKDFSLPIPFIVTLKSSIPLGKIMQILHRNWNRSIVSKKLFTFKFVQTSGSKMDWN